MTSSAPLSDQTIVCLATQEWEAHWTTVQQVMARLAPRNRVVYIEPFHPPLAWLKSSNAVLRRQRRQRLPRLREVRPGLLVYRPGYPYAPFTMRSAAAAAFNSRLVRAELARLLRRLELKRPWLWAFFAQSLSVLDLPFGPFIYDCVDDWPSLFSHPREHRFIARIDEALCRRADLVFVGSEPLRERKAPLNPKTFVVNHAADIALFMKAADPDTLIPADLAAIPRPRIGFVGMMDTSRFDSDLIARLAANPAYHVVLVGGFIRDGGRDIPRRPNVHVLGMKAVEALPAYLKGMDVCLMPYRVNEATRYIYPLKLYEYLATGKPVVATAIPSVADLGSLLYVATDPREFVDHVAAALAERDPERVTARRRYASTHSWEAHVDRKLRLIAEHLGR
jgi:glycosyltransferase involved in cell wall biosynthesis